MKTVATGFCAILLLVSMAVMVWVNAFPKDPVIEEKMAFIKEQSAKRAELIKELEQEHKQIK